MNRVDAIGDRGVPGSEQFGPSGCSDANCPSLNGRIASRLKLVSVILINSKPTAKTSLVEKNRSMKSTSGWFKKKAGRHSATNKMMSEIFGAEFTLQKHRPEVQIVDQRLHRA